MSLIRGSGGRRSVQVEVEVPGTPDEVWRAIATGPGVSAWFVPTEFREDGAVVSNFGPGMESMAKVTAWDAPHRFSAESADFGPEAPSIATEWIVEARSGETCVVRVVHSLFSETDDWDTQLESFEGGWPGFFRILRLYLAHFSGQPSAVFQVMGNAPEPAGAAWTAFTQALGLEELAEGAPVATAGDAPALAGVAEQVGPPEYPLLLARLERPAPGLAHLFAMPMGGAILLCQRLYLYGESAAETVAREEPRWQAWMQAHFPFPTGEG